MRVLMVGGSPEPSSPELVSALASTCDRVVAVDRGMDALLAAGRVPDLFCGDCDTASGASRGRLAELERSGGCDVERYDPHKDFTDLTLALDAVHRRWRGAELVLTCFGGGRPDHLLAVLGSLMRAPFAVFLEEDGYSGRILRAGETWGIDGRSGSEFSLIALAGDAVVSERGMEWELDRSRVGALSDLGVSNVVRSDRALAACHEGAVAAFAFRPRRHGGPPRA